MAAMNKPIAEFKGKGVRITVWEGPRCNSYTLEKYWKNKETGEWERKKMSLWPSEIEELVGLLIQANDFERASNAAPQEPPSDGPEEMFSPQYVRPEHFNDDDIPF